MKTKSYLLSLGWSVDAARERLAACRANVSKFRNSHNKSYRQINAALYLKYRNFLTILSS